MNSGKFLQSPQCNSIALSVVVAACWSGATTQLMPPCAAQTTSAAPTSLWSKLKAADARITACRVVWQRTATTKPQPKQDPEKSAVRSMEQARQQGRSSAEIKKDGEETRTLIQQHLKGYTQSQTLSYVRVGAKIKCEVETNSIADTAQTPSQSLGRDIDFYDGENAISIPMPAEGDKAPPRGQLTRDAKEILPHSSGGFGGLQFFAGAPLTQVFSPIDSTLYEAADGTLILEKKIKTPRIYIMRVTLGKETLRPSKLEVIDVSYAPDNVTRMTRVATGYRRYADGVWFPSEIVTNRGYGGEKDVLVKAAFNEAVDPLETRLPPNTTLADGRFGQDKVIGYRLQNGQVPSDEEVKKMQANKKAEVGDSAKAEAAVPKPQPSSTLPITPVLGLLCMALGGALWMKTGRQEHDV